MASPPLTPVTSTAGSKRYQGASREKGVHLARVDNQPRRRVSGTRLASVEMDGTVPYAERMAVAALIVSILALLVALKSAFYARKQAGMAARAREQAETPGFNSAIEIENPGSDTNWYVLRLTLATQWPVTGLQIAIIDGTGVEFTPSQAGVDNSSVPILAAEWDNLGPGDTAVWRVRLAESPSITVRMRIICKGRDNFSWAIPIEVAVPRESRII